MKLIEGIIYIIGIIFLFILIHENTHVVIDKYFGCEDIQVHFFGKSGIAYTTAKCDPTEALALAHSINEIVGYNIMPLLVLIMYLTMVNKSE